jgi:hypothetical protein
VRRISNVHFAWFLFVLWTAFEISMKNRFSFSSFAAPSSHNTLGTPDPRQLSFDAKTQLPPFQQSSRPDEIAKKSSPDLQHCGAASYPLAHVGSTLQRLRQVLRAQIITGETN